ncbi:membrane protein insertase YidC [Aureimonas populi]|uniref:Membrane protein insertase YidC n=1 Tax=Aureimonas populi TaxID=1701758 RepID=A0ABW5CIW6_9HYPH|nr:membrane protein insertase YidC [Aureimonas populi]
MENNRNFLLAMALSIAVLVGWQFFVVSPRMEVEQSSGVTAEPGSLQAPTVPAGEPQERAFIPSGPESVPLEGEAPQPAAAPQAAAEAPRVAIDTPQLAGTINLRGARIDDLRLKSYRETVDEDSPNIVLLAPETDANGYFAEFGYSGQNVGELPGPATLWESAGEQTLTPATPVVLTFTNPQGLTFTREISVDANYLFTVTDTVLNEGGQAVTLSPYGRVVRFSKPEVAAAFVVFEGLIGVLGEDGLNEITYSSIEDEGRISPPQSGFGWLGITDKYWATALVPGASGDAVFQPNFRYSGEGRAFYQSDYLAQSVTLEPGASSELTNRLFAGAKVVGLVKAYEEELGIARFTQLIDWGWFHFITRPMFTAIDWIYNFTGNFGVAILLVTVFIKLLFFPLANKSYKSMAQMKKVQPRLMELREKYGDDRVKQQQEMMKIYKEEKINPAAGCWPVLVQIPVFFALYKVLYVTIEMRHAPFFGWIQDLAAPDPTSIFNLFGLIPISLPLFLMIGVWPILMGITMFIQMKLNPLPPDPTQQLIFTWMPIVFTFMLATFPAGLVIYWTWNNFLSIIQQSVIMKRNGAKIELWDNLRATFRRKKDA